MMRYAILQGGVVVDGPAAGSPAWAAEVGAVEIPPGLGVRPGWTLSGDPSLPGSWSPPPDTRTLARAQEAALAEIEGLHADRLAGGAPIGAAWPGVMGAISTSSRTDWLGALVLSGQGVLPLPHTVELLGDATVTLTTAQEIADVVGALLGAYLALDGARIAARAAVRAASTPAEVDSAVAQYRAA